MCQIHAKRAPNYYTQPFYFTSPYPMQGSGVVPDPRMMCTYRSLPLGPVVNHGYHSLSYRQRDRGRKSTLGLLAKPDADNEFWSPLEYFVYVFLSTEGEEYFDRKVQIHHSSLSTKRFLSICGNACTLVGLPCTLLPA